MDENEFSLGVSLYEEGDYQKSLEYLNDFLEKDRSHALTYCYQARNLEKLSSSNQEILNTYFRALSYDNTNSFILENFLRFCLKTNETKTFLSYLPNYFKGIKDKNEKFLQESFDLLCKTGNYTLVFKFLLQVYEYDKQDIYFLLRLSSISIKLYKYNEAEFYTKEILKINPDDINAFRNLTLINAQKGLLKEVLEYSSKVLAKFPEDIITLKSIGQTYEKNNLLEKALEAYLQLAEKNRVSEFDFQCLYIRFLMGETEVVSGILDLFERTKLSKAGFFTATYHFKRKEFDKAWIYFIKWREVEKFGLSLRNLEPNLSWKGQNLENKIIVAQLEQGKGDIVNFGRFLQTIIERKVKKILIFCRCDEEKNLISSFSFFDEEKISFIKGKESYHYHTSLFLVPAQLGFTFSDLKDFSFPYVVSKDIYKKKWLEILEPYKDEYKVALCWKGNPNYHLDYARSMYKK